MGPKFYSYRHLFHIVSKFWKKLSYHCGSSCIKKQNVAQKSSEPKFFPGVVRAGVKKADKETEHNC